MDEPVKDSRPSHSQVIQRSMQVVARRIRRVLFDWTLLSRPERLPGGPSDPRGFSTQQIAAAVGAFWSERPRHREFFVGMVEPALRCLLAEGQVKVFGDRGDVCWLPELRGVAGQDVGDKRRDVLYWQRRGYYFNGEPIDFTPSRSTFLRTVELEEAPVPREALSLDRESFVQLFDDGTRGYQKVLVDFGFSEELAGTIVCRNDWRLTFHPEAPLLVDPRELPPPSDRLDPAERSEILREREELAELSRLLESGEIGGSRGGRRRKGTTRKAPSRAARTAKKTKKTQPTSRTRRTRSRT
ncbi:MAG: hypothetical protein O7J95_04160 [Planctomycetota bacterium]|nr:hypothetical protein [Planctomycetota bacterium]